jgi:hypothetical protein
VLANCRERLTGASALKVLERAGTSREYAGLWRDVAAYSPPMLAGELPELPEVADVRSLAAAMAKIDRSHDLLKLCRDADWSVPTEHPDVVPAQQALQLREASQLTPLTQPNSSGRNRPVPVIGMERPSGPGNVLSGSMPSR